MKASRTVLLTLLCLLTGVVSGQYAFKGSIVDDDTGLLVSATVSLTTAEGEVLAPEGQHDLVLYLDKKRWYVEGEFSIVSPVPGLRIEIRRGLETLPLVEEMDLSAGENQSIQCLIPIPNI